MWFEEISQIVLAKSRDPEEQSPLIKLIPVLIFIGLSVLSKIAKIGSKKPKKTGSLSAPPSPRKPSTAQAPSATPMQKPLPPYAQKSNLPYAVKTPPPTSSGTREVRPTPRPAAHVPRRPTPAARPAGASRTQLPQQKPGAPSKPHAAKPVPGRSVAVPPPPQRVATPAAVHPTHPIQVPVIEERKPAEVRTVSRKVSAVPSAAAAPIPSAYSRQINLTQPQTLVQAVILSEILAKPIGLRQNSVYEF